MFETNILCVSRSGNWDRHMVKTILLTCPQQARRLLCHDVPRRWPALMCSSPFYSLMPRPAILPRPSLTNTVYHSIVLYQLAAYAVRSRPLPPFLDVTYSKRRSFEPASFLSIIVVGLVHVCMTCRICRSIYEAWSTARDCWQFRDSLRWDRQHYGTRVETSWRGFFQTLAYRRTLTGRFRALVCDSPSRHSSPLANMSLHYAIFYYLLSLDRYEPFEGSFRNWRSV